MSGSFTPSVNCRSVQPGTVAVLELIEQVRLAARALVEFSGHLFDPTIRLGVTGLSHAGKTVFITALVHGLLRGGRFPVFEALATGRVARTRRVTAAVAVTPCNVP
jgi:predicted YcjX-like family ATPase